MNRYKNYVIPMPVKKLTGISYDLFSIHFTFYGHIKKNNNDSKSALFSFY